MGDPAVDVWTAFPEPLAVTHPATIAVGANAVTVTVTQDESPVAGALVCLSKGAETYVVGSTDAAGQVELPIDAATAGNMLLTVTKHDAQPYLATIPVGTPNVHVGYLSSTIDDASGSNDGIVNPGETIELRVQLRNSGTTAATGVSAVLTSADPYVTIIDGNETFPNVAPGGIAATVDDFDFQVALECPHGRSLRFGLDVTTAEGQWHSLDRDSGRLSRSHRRSDHALQRGERAPRSGRDGRDESRSRQQRHGDGGGGLRHADLAQLTSSRSVIRTVRSAPSRPAAAGTTPAIASRSPRPPAPTAGSSPTSCS